MCLAGLSRFSWEWLFHKVEHMLSRSLASAGMGLTLRLLHETDHPAAQYLVDTGGADPVPLSCAARPGSREALLGTDPGDRCRGRRREVTRFMVILWSEMLVMLLFSSNSAVTPIDFRASTRL